MKNTPIVWGQRPHAGGGGKSPAKEKWYRMSDPQGRGEGGKPWRKVGTPRAPRGARGRRVTTPPRSEAEGRGRRAADGGGDGKGEARSRQGDA